jgi:hypothetical protein
VGAEGQEKRARPEAAWPECLICHGDDPCAGAGSRFCLADAAPVIALVDCSKAALLPFIKSLSRARQRILGRHSDGRTRHPPCRTIYRLPRTFLTVQAPASSASLYCRISPKSLACSLERGPQLRRICVLTAQLHQLDPLFCKFGGGTQWGFFV